MKIHHRVWLENHPNRTVEWLQARLDEGFHIHHIDNNHENNDPFNLILIEGVDHYASIHGYSYPAARSKIERFTFKGRGYKQKEVA